MERYQTVQEQIDTIRKVADEVCQSRESALKFLRDAGIISEDDEKEAINLDKKENVYGQASTFTGNGIS